MVRGFQVFSGAEGFSGLAQQAAPAHAALGGRLHAQAARGAVVVRGLGVTAGQGVALIVGLGRGRGLAGLPMWKPLGPKERG